MTVSHRISPIFSPSRECPNTASAHQRGPWLRGFLACVALLVGWGPLGGPAAFGSPVADVYFGRGVQAYFDEQWGRAEAYFDRATQYAPNEPRAYYFRGLARRRLERPLKAENDLRQGALIEAQKGRVYALGGALQSLVGEDKRLLDKVRVEMLSDLAAYRDGAGLPKGSDRGRRALRSEFRMPLSLLTEIDSAEQLAELVERQRPVWASRSRLSPAEMLTEDAPEPPAAGPDTAPADENEQAASGLAESSRERDAAQDTGGAAAESEPFDGSAPDSDPFASADDQGDPFGDDPDPFGGDPFGGDSGDADPFGDETPADEPMDADPFSDDPFGDDADPFG